MDSTSAWLGLLFGFAGCVPYLGLLTGPIALYLGVRGRRSRHRGAAAWALGLGTLTILFAICRWGLLLSGQLSDPSTTP